MSRRWKMKVTVRAYAMLPAKLARRCPERLPPGFHAGMPLTIEITDSEVVETLLSELKLGKSEVLNVFVNGRSMALDAPLSSGDEVGLFPPVGGG
jgi:molybdopterin converting factor small subunit